jgi:2-polyprenyl-3-methyl-5-hydroxy-6-metoxy-1,4-benzoquinol methylase
MSQWYEQLFRNFAASYEHEIFTRGTIGEVDFIEQEIKRNNTYSILDIGCGTGRHAIELAKRGYAVTGIDLSSAMLKKAQHRATESGVSVRFLRRDARSFRFSKPFDLVLMICEGAFPLMETDEMNFSILRNAARSLKPRRKFILTTLNGLFPLIHSVKKFMKENIQEGRTDEHWFDILTFRDHSVYELRDDSGKKMRLQCNERYYIPSEISWQLKTLGFSTVEIFGCPQGQWNRKTKLTTNDYEMLVVATKK